MPSKKGHKKRPKKPSTGQSNSGGMTLPPPPDVMMVQTGEEVQDPQPQTMSNNGPGARFFERASNVNISESQFQDILGHHISVILNLSESRPQGGDDSSDRTPRSNVRELPPMPDERVPNSRGVVRQQKGNEVYQRHLQTKRPGFPLWIPEPNKQLCVAYRKKGISVGDVGTITPNGGFSFLFNICVSADDPINPPILPEGFRPIDPPIADFDICVFDEFKPNSYLASTEIHELHDQRTPTGMLFQTSESEGAILAMPDGATAVDLENISRIRKYAAENIESWYRYVNGPRGREAKNGEVRLVVGCDKTTSWGMAALTNTMTQQGSISHLRFKRAEDLERRDAALAHAYTWELSGMAEAKVGPNPQEIEGLRRNDTQSDGLLQPQSEYQNQCLFIRTLNLMMNKNQWAALSNEIAMKTDVHNSSTEFPASKNGKQVSAKQKSSPSIGSGPTGITPLFLNSHQDLVRDLITSVYLDGRVYHPSDVINKVLLAMVPSAKMVASCDRDWYTLNNSKDLSSLSIEQVCDMLLFQFNIREEDGIVFLEPREEPGDVYTEFIHHTIHPLPQSDSYEIPETPVTSTTPSLDSSPSTNGNTSPSVPPDISRCDESPDQYVHALPPPMPASTTEIQTGDFATKLDRSRDDVIQVIRTNDSAWGGNPDIRDVC